MVDIGEYSDFEAIQLLKAIYGADDGKPLESSAGLKLMDDAASKCGGMFLFSAWCFDGIMAAETDISLLSVLARSRCVKTMLACKELLANIIDGC